MPTTPKKARKGRSDTVPLQREIVSDDGVLGFVLQRAGVGVQVTRSEKRANGSRATVSVLFHDVEAFERFCAADGLRFAYPLIYDQASRAFDHLLSRRS